MDSHKRSAPKRTTNSSSPIFTPPGPGPQKMLANRARRTLKRNTWKLEEEGIESIREMMILAR
jgi:hypothetical protein